MSFWKGLAAGMESAQAKREREEAVATADSRYAASEARKDKAEALAAKALARTHSRQDKEDARQEVIQGQQDILFEQGQADWKMDNAERSAKILGTLTGGAGTGNKKKGGGAGEPSSKDLEKAMLGYNGWVGDTSEMSEDDQEYHRIVGNDPKASQAVLDFLASESGKNRSVTPENLPRLMILAGRTKGTGEEAYQELQEQIANGNFDVDDPESVARGLLIALKHTPSEAVMVQAGAGTSNTDLTPAATAKSFEGMMVNQIHAAQVKASNEGNEELKAELGRIGQDLRSTEGAVRYRAISQALELGAGVELYHEMDMGNNPYFSGIGPKTPVAPVATQNPVTAADEATGLPNTPPPSVGPPEAPPAPLRDINKARPIEQAFLNAYTDPNISNMERQKVVEEAVAMHPQGIEGVKKMVDLYTGGKYWDSLGGPEEMSDTPPTASTETPALADLQADEVITNTVPDEVPVIRTKYGESVTWEEYKKGNAMGQWRAGLTGNMNEEEFNLEALRLKAESEPSDSPNRGTPSALGKAPEGDKAPSFAELTLKRGPHKGRKVTFKEYEEGNALGQWQAGLPSRMDEAQFNEMADKPDTTTDFTYEEAAEFAKLLEDPDVDPWEIVEIFEQDHGEGSADRAFDLIHNQ